MWNLDSIPKIWGRNREGLLYGERIHQLISCGPTGRGSHVGHTIGSTHTVWPKDNPRTIIISRFSVARNLSLMYLGNTLGEIACLKGCYCTVNGSTSSLAMGPRVVDHMWVIPLARPILFGPRITQELL